MPLSHELTCAGCGARVVLRGARVFTPQPCPACGATIRGRVEIGGYRLGEVLARSGLAVIFRATDLAGAELAVKVIQPPFAAELMDVEYFVSEVWALARLNHPHCVRIFATGVESGLAWIAMEWLPHGSLAARLLARGKLREAEVLAIGLQAAGALGAADTAGHLHHDLKPANLVFADARTVKVTDFGQAALYRIAASDLGTMWGRASTVAPERLRGEPEETHSDIYALGTVLFQALTGGAPRGGEPNPLTALELLETEEIRVENCAAGLHEKTVYVLNKMLAAEPGQRFQQWGEVSAQLGQAASLVARRDAAAATTKSSRASARPPRPARQTPAPALRWRGRAIVLATALAVLAGLVFWKLRPVPQTPAPVKNPHHSPH